MATNPLAFGPLSPESARAATLLGGPSFSGLNLSRLTGRSFGEPQQAAQSPQEPVGLATGSAAPVEEQQPLLPQGEATGERGDVAQLPGFQAAVAPGGAAELPSSAELLPGAQRQSSEFHNTLQRLLNEGVGATGVTRQPTDLPEAWRTDLSSAMKGLQSVAGGLKGVDSAVGGGLGGLASLYGLASSVEQGNPVGAIQGALGAYSGLTSAAGVAPISSALASVAPETAAAIATSMGVQVGAQAGTEAIATALSTALSGAAGAAAPVIAGIVAYIGAQEEKHARESGWMNNPIKGALYSNATAGVDRAQQLLKGLGEPSTASTADLAQGLVGGLNSLRPYYGTAEGGVGPVRASDTLTGTLGQQGLGGEGQYTQNFTDAQQGLVRLVGELMNRGVPYEELGKLPVSNDWGLASQDLSNPASTFYGQNAGKWNTEGQDILNRAMASPLLQRTGLNNENLMLTLPNAPPTENAGPVFNPSDWTPERLFAAAPGAAGAAPDAVTKAGGLQSAMYGGPLWQALARMGGGTGAGAVGEPIWNAIGAHFDPWVNARQETPNQILATMGLPVDVTGEPALGPAASSTWMDPYWQSIFGQAPSAAPSATDGGTTPSMGTSPDLTASLQRLIGQTGGQAGALSPTVPSEFVTALRNPAALQSLLQQPGLLARLFQTPVAGGQP